MNETPKATKSRGKSTLSLNKKLTKRLSSPQKRIINTDSSNTTVNSFDSNDGTPPHKRRNLDDSYDSPTNFESNHSPTDFLSQTFCPDSPEVGWRWTRDVENRTKSKKCTMQGSGISSNASCSVELTTQKRTQRETSQAYPSKQNDKIRKKVSELHRASKIRSEAILRERLSKLEDKLKISSSTKTLVQQKPVSNVVLQPVTAESDTVDMANFSDLDSMFDDSLLFESVENVAPVKPVANSLEGIDDFFNDSDTDCLLIAASQQVESALPKHKLPEVSASMPEQISHGIVKSCSVTRPKSNKEKRSSLYMKFLEDDEDDLFASLDDATVLKASQPRNTRSPFQRYKSMPATTATTSTSTLTSKSTIINSSGTKMDYSSWSLKDGVRESNAIATSSLNSNKASIKRHSSSHAICPSTSNRRF